MSSFWVVEHLGHDIHHPGTQHTSSTPVTEYFKTDMTEISIQRAHYNILLL